MEEVIWKLCDKEEAEKIIRHLKTKAPQLLSFCRNPMFLIYTARVLKESISDLPDTISGIMVSVLQIFSTSIHSDADIKILMKLAYHGMMDNRFTFTKTYVDKLKISYSQLRSLISVDAALVPFQDQVDEDDLRFQFSHQLLQELLAALHLFNLTQDGFDNHVLNVSNKFEMEVVARLLYGIVYNSRTRMKVSKYILDGNCDIEYCKATLMQQLRSYIDDGEIRDEKVISLIHEAGSDVTTMLQPEVNQILIDHSIDKPEWNHVILSVINKFSQLERVFLWRLEVTGSMMPLLAESVDKVKNFEVYDIRLSGEIPLEFCEQLGKVLKNAVFIYFDGCVLTPEKLRKISEGMARVEKSHITFSVKVLNDASMDSSCMSHLVDIVTEGGARLLQFEMCEINKEKIEALREKLQQTEHKLQGLVFVEESFVATHEDIASICQILPQIENILLLQGWEITEPDIQTLQDALNSGLSTTPSIYIRNQSVDRLLIQDKRPSKIVEKQQSSTFSTATSIDPNETEIDIERGVIEESLQVDDTAASGVKDTGKKRSVEVTIEATSSHHHDSITVHDVAPGGGARRGDVAPGFHHEDRIVDEDKTAGQICDEQESRRVHIEPSTDTCVDEHGAETGTEQRRRVIDEGATDGERINRPSTTAEETLNTCNIMSGVGTSKITDEREVRTIHTEQSIGTCMDESTEAENNTEQRGGVIEKDDVEISDEIANSEEELDVCTVTKDGQVIVSKTTRKEIGSDGGAITVGGCVVTFPKDSLKRKTEIVAKAEINSAKWPKGYFLITPMLYVDGGRNFSRPASVRMRSWCFNDGSEENKNAKVDLLHRADGSDKWDPISVLPLTNKTVFQFECMNFSPYAIGIRELWFSRQTFVIQPFLFTNLQNTLVYSFSVADEMALKAVRKIMRDSGYTFFTTFSTPSVKKGDDIRVRLRCVSPEGFLCDPSEASFQIGFKMAKMDRHFEHFSVNSASQDSTKIKLESSILKNGVAIANNQRFFYKWQNEAANSSQHQAPEQTEQVPSQARTQQWTTIQDSTFVNASGYSTASGGASEINRDTGSAMTAVLIGILVAIIAFLFFLLLQK